MAKPENKQLEISSAQLPKAELPVQSCPEECITQSLGYAIMLCGLSAANMPAKLEKAVLLKFVRDNYPDYTPDEIKFAFEKAMARKYGPEVDVKCYGNFSCEYFGRILEAYENWDPGGERARSMACEYALTTSSAIKIENEYQRFLNNENPEYIQIGFYHTLKEQKLVPTLPYKLSRRAFQRQMAILTGFTFWKSKGYKNLYKIEETQNLLKAI